METITQFFEDLGWLANVAEFIGFAVLIWTVINVHILRTEQREANKKISLLLEVEGISDLNYALPGTIRRKDFSRGEIYGRLGMIPLKEGTRWQIRYVQTNPKFLEKIEEIYNLIEDTTMTIHLTKEEFDQFQFTPSFYDRDS